MQNKIRMKEVIKLIPNHCFEKSLLKSLFFMCLDFLMLISCFWTYQYLPLILFWNIYGFIMWMLVAVGHDCGHQSFSHYPMINAICGHICFSVAFIPFFPWTSGHNLHHVHHNHVSKDNGHPWYPKTEYIKQKKWIDLVNLFGGSMIPLYMICGMIDHFYLGFAMHGSPLIPTKLNECLKCTVSSGFLLLILYIIFGICNVNFYSFLLYYGGCWICCVCWMFMVTYLHHHHENGATIYTDDTWNFTHSALETIDRKYGFGIDTLHHHISDCHVVHHLFFSKIPHYHLKEATNAIRPYLEKHKVYHCKQHRNVFLDFVRIFRKNYYIAKLKC